MRYQVKNGIGRVGLVLLVALGSGCGKDYTETVIFDRTETISQQWLTVRFPRPILSEEQRVQELLATVSTPYEISTDPLGMRMQNGTVLWPEVEIQMEDGYWLPLRSRGFWGRLATFSTERGGFGDGKKYVSVRLRCTSPVAISRLVWNSYDPKEVKR
jgi:hypothetical protein